MASLIFAAGFLTYNKVKDKHDRKREAKKKQHTEWYEDLQREHSKTLEEKTKAASPQATGSASNPFEGGHVVEKRQSSDTLKDEDGPDKWVEEVVRERTKSRGNSS